MSESFFVVVAKDLCDNSSQCVVTRDRIGQDRTSKSSKVRSSGGQRCEGDDIT